MFKLNNWYFRLLFSYFPILVLTVSMIIFLSFITVNEISRSETAKADSIATGYAVDSLERAVHKIEMNVMNEAVENQSYAAYLNDSSERDYIYQVAHSLRALIEDNELIKSIYLYRLSDDMVLTTSGQTVLSDFGDRSFIKQLNEYRGWSPVREFREYDWQKPVEVISMYKQTPLPFGKEGVLVINIDMYEVEQMIGGMTNNHVSFMRVTDAAGQQIYPEVETSKNGKVLTTASSEILGWTFESGIQAGKLFDWVSVVSYAWVIISVLTIGFAVIYIIWVTRRNYKPIQMMMNRIEAIQLRSNVSGTVGMDDLTMIDRALENLIDQSLDYEKEQRESVMLQRRQLFNELIGGELTEQVYERMRKLDALPGTGQYAVMVVKLMRYDAFQVENTHNEQKMLKYALGNVMQELGRNEGLQGWGEWSAPDRVTFLLATQDTNASLLEQLHSTATIARKWVEEHLRLTLSIGIGDVVDDWRRIGHSYRAALTGMEYQLTIGRDAITFSGDIPQVTAHSVFNYMQLCSDCVQEFRLTNEHWRDSIEHMFKQLETDTLKDEDIHSLLILLLQILNRELKDLSDRINSCLEGEIAEALHERLKEASSLAELKGLWLDYMADLYDEYVSVTETKSYKALITEMRAYIEENFADPDLSLKHLSDRFQISGKYASHLFKLEYDMKFVDFLVQLRMQQAERLLADTDETVQNIALQVGYANSITFGRVFKRITGVTPGEFRRLKMRPSVPS